MDFWRKNVDGFKQPCNWKIPYQKYCKEMENRNVAQLLPLLWKENK